MKVCAVRALRHALTAAPTVMEPVPTELLVLAEISPSLLALAPMAAHVAAEGSSAALFLSLTYF